MPNQPIVTAGLVLRETVTRETDKILTVLTPDRGKISLIARGARRKNSRLAAACQLLAYSELTIYEKGQWFMLDEAETLELFTGLRTDFVALSLASYLADLTDATAQAEDTSQLLRLLLNALYALSVLHKPPQLVKPAFELRLMALSGFEPLADGCAVCGGRSLRIRYWTPSTGWYAAPPAGKRAGLAMAPVPRRSGGPAPRAVLPGQEALQLHAGYPRPAPAGAGGGGLCHRPAGAQLPDAGLL